MKCGKRCEIYVRDNKGRFIETNPNTRYKNHRKVWEEIYGKVPNGCCIHHINGNKHDNRIDNLVCLTYSQHNKIHSKNRRVWNRGLIAQKNQKLLDLINKRDETKKINYIIKSIESFYIYNAIKNQENTASFLGISRRQLCDRLRDAKKVI
jgi:hypothetical protein